MKPKTVTELIAELATEVEVLMSELMSRSAFKHDPAGHFRRLGIPVMGDYCWEPLREEGERARSKANREYGHLLDIVRVLLRREVDGVKKRLDKPDRAVRKAIDQNERPHEKTAAEIFQRATKALREITSVVATIYGHADGEPVLVPDTNALLHNHRLEDWRFEDLSTFTIVLVPTVLSELDKLKVDHRKSESVRDKATSLIRMIKGYRERGRLTDGVPLVKGVSRIQSLAVEPDLSESLPWLDKDNQDDRILALVIEVMREHPRSPVILVTRDVNLQNKCEFARLPFAEPPDPEALPGT